MKKIPSSTYMSITFNQSGSSFHRIKLILHLVYTVHLVFTSGRFVSPVICSKFSFLDFLKKLNEFKLFYFWNFYYETILRYSPHFNYSSPISSFPVISLSPIFKISHYFSQIVFIKFELDPFGLFDRYQ